jgi:hypothetical protein
MNMFAAQDKAKSDAKNIRGLKLGGDQAYGRSNDKVPL